MSNAKAHAIENAVMPRDGRLPSNVGMLIAQATLSFCPCVSVERRSRKDYIATLISDTLVQADFLG